VASHPGADSAADRAQPRPKSLGLIQLIEVLQSQQERGRQGIFGIFSLPTNADHLPVNRVLVSFYQV